MKKNLHIEIFRSIALLLVVVYHIQILFAEHIFNNSYINMIISFGGEIGVTMFFIISGYCIYKSIELKKEKNNYTYKSFLIKRIKRIATPYYFCLMIGLTLTGSAMYLSRKGLFDIFTHLTFTHNLFVETHGSINGALWTMGTFAQFYLIAPLMYDFIKKNPKITTLIIILGTIISKYIVFNILNKLSLSNSYYFVYGRQLITALDNFALGMYLAELNKVNTKKNNIKINFLLIVLCLFAIVLIINIGNSNGIYMNSYIGYIWHSLLAIVIACILKIYMTFEINTKNIINKIMMYIGKYEYEIYLWHFILVGNLMGTKLVIYAKNVSIICSTVLVLFISILFGIIMSKYHENN